MSLPKYPAYKDSGVKWLGQIPEHWLKMRLKQAAKINMGQSPNSDECNQDGRGIPFLQGNADFGIKSPLPRHFCEVAKKTAQPSDILFSVRAPVGAINLADQVYGIGRGLCAISPVYFTEQSFLMYALETIKIELFSVATGSTYEAVSIEQIGNAFYFSPPKSEQTLIAQFLDRETAKIDDLIAEQEKLITLLDEKRQAMISHAVTKGLNPNVPMKDSGVEWLGEVPEHWDVRKLRAFVMLTNGFAFNSNDFIDEGVQIIRIGNLYQNILDLSRQPTFVSDKLIELHQNWLISNGDILISLTGTLGKRDYGYAIRFNSTSMCLLNQRVAKINCININDSFVLEYLHSELFLSQIYSQASGTKQANLSNEDILESLILVPPTDEQIIIASFLQQQSEQLDTLKAEAQRGIELLKERRSALISAAVTGKIDVRHAMTEQVAT